MKKKQGLKRILSFCMAVVLLLGMTNTATLLTVKAGGIVPTLPEIELLSNTNVAWENADVILSGTVSNGEGDFEQYLIRYSKNAEDFSADTYEAKPQGVEEVMVNEDGTFSITVKALVDERLDADYYVWVYDGEGTKSVATKEEHVKIGATANPTVATVTKNPDTQWSKQDVTISGTVGKGSGGFEHFSLRYSQDKDKFFNNVYETEDDQVTKVAVDAEGNYSFTIQANDNVIIEPTYYLWVYDKEKRKSDSCNSMEVKINTSKLEIKELKKSPTESTSRVKVKVSATIGGVGNLEDAMVRYSKDESAFARDTLEHSVGTDAVYKDNEFSFDIDNGESFKGLVYVWVYDEDGTKCETQKDIEIDIKTPFPVVNSVTKDPGNDWTNKAVTIKVDAKQNAETEVDYQAAGFYYNTKNKIDKNKKVILGSDGQYFLIIEPGEGVKDTYYIWAINESENESVYPTLIDVKIDTKKPIITAYDFKPKNKNIVAKAINFVTGGLCFKESIEVTVTAEDKGSITSDLKEITLYQGDTALPAQAVNANGEATFTLEVPFDATISATATDHAGNTCDRIAPSSLDQTMTGDQVILEDEKPTITVDVSDAYYTTDKNKQWYKESADFTIQLEDQDSGLKTVDVSINGQPVTHAIDSQDPTIETEIKTDYKDANTKTATYMVSSSQVAQSEDDTYTLQVTVVDQAGNQETITKTVLRDTKAPSISNIQFSPMGAGDVKAQIIKTSNYGYFFKQNTVVTLTAKDNENGSGVNTITYYTEDFSKNKAGIKSQIMTKAVNKKNQYSFAIPADFKGKIYAKATDHVALTSEFVSPAATIIESQKSHKETASITLDKPAATAKDNQGIEVYTQDVPLTFTASDPYSGLAKVEWSVESPYDTQNNQSGQVTINQDGDIEDAQAGATVTGRDKNLATKVTKTIQVANNSNNIKVKVKLTDKVGHTTQEELNFSIDKTAPTIAVTYDNNEYDKDFANETQYYKAGRTATITVTERNFRENDAKVTITSSDGAAPTLSNWVEQKSSQGEDHNTYTATISYAQDGDYRFGMTYKDLAGNHASNIEQQTFTIDKTSPTLQVNYDNNQVEANNYYKEARTATITINEHNFETSRIKTTLTAQEGKAVPSISGWTTNGDLHTATLTFQEDSIYTFNMEYADKAGNPAEKLPDTSFCVDQTKPTLTVTGIKHNSANNGKDANKNEIKVGFIIETTDENFANATPHLNQVTLEGTKNCDSLLGSPQNIQNGLRYVVQNLEKDGVYQLTTTATDKAGNETKAARVTHANGTVVEAETITFSVNRNGSVYTLNEQTQSINGSYSKEETDILIQETNVNQLKEMKLTLFHDNTTKVLKEGTDFKLDKTTGDGQWNQYTYTVFKENFKEDGFYNLALYSVDEAENESENTTDTKNVEVRFAIDKTAPNLIVTDLKDKEAYEEDSKEVTMVINDNMKLEGVSIYHTTYQGSANNNDYSAPSATWTAEEIQKMQEENVDFTYHIDGTTTEKHKVKIVARDAAGSETVVEVADFYVTKDRWINYKTDSVKVIGTIGGITFLVVGFMGVMMLRRRKKNVA